MNIARPAGFGQQIEAFGPGRILGGQRIHRMDHCTECPSPVQKRIKVFVGHDPQRDLDPAAVLIVAFNPMIEHHLVGPKRRQLIELVPQGLVEIALHGRRHFDRQRKRLVFVQAKPYLRLAVAGLRQDIAPPAPQQLQVLAGAEHVEHLRLAVGTPDPVVAAARFGRHDP